MKHSVTRFLFAALFIFLTAAAATAAQDEVFLAQMKVTREINLGSTYEYEVEAAGRGRAILKTTPLRLKPGEAINLFVVEGAKENGRPAYMALSGRGARSFKEGLAAVDVGGAWNFIDKNGRLLSQGRFEKVRDFRNGFALCKLASGYVFLGKDGQFLNSPMIYPSYRGYELEIRYKHDFGFGEDTALMVSQTKSGNEVYIVLDRTGAVKRVQLENTENLYRLCALPFTEGLAAVESRKGFAYIDTNGKVAIPPKFQEATPFSEGLAAVKNNSKWGFIDKSGKYVVEPKYEDVRSFSEGFAAVKQGGKWGFIDKTGKVTVNLSYDGAQPYSDGLAAVKRGQYWGYVDKGGQVAVKFLFSQAKPFVNGLAPVKDEKGEYNARWGYINKSGNFAVRQQFYSAEPFSDGLALASEWIRGTSGVYKWKYINTKGQAALWFYMAP